MSIQIQLAGTEPEYAAWDEFVVSCPSTSFFATTHWLGGYAGFGLDCKFILATNSQGEVVGGAPLAIYRWGPLSWVSVPHGPVASPGHLQILPELLEAVEDYTSELGAMFVQVMPFERAPFDKRWEDYATQCLLPYDPQLPRGVEDGVTDLLRSRGYRHSADIGFVKVPRDGQIVQLDTDDLASTFRKETRRKLHQTWRSDTLEVHRVDSLDALAVTYELVKENVDRYSGSMRPWSTFRSAIMPGIRRNCMTVLTAYYNAEPCSTIVVAFGGRRAARIFAAQRRIDVGPCAPAYLLVYESMLETRRRGFQEYDLTSVTQGGVQQFKRSFRPSYYRLSEPLVKAFKPSSTRLCLAVLPRLRKNRHVFASLMYGARRLKRRVLHREGLA